jgi:hypothetical protein
MTNRPAGVYQRHGMKVTDDGVVLEVRVTVRHDASLQTGLSSERTNH